MKKNFYLISRIYSPLYSAFISHNWEHTGSPAYYNFIKSIDKSDDINLELFFLLDKDSSKFLKPGKVKFSNLNNLINIVPYFIFRNSLMNKFEGFINKVYQYLYVFLRVNKKSIYYIDRNNILLGNLLFFKKGLIVYRVLGITAEIYTILFKEKGLKNKLFSNALNLNNSMIISSNDGSYAEKTKKNLLNNKFYLMFNGCDIKGISEPKCMKKDDKIIISYISRLEEGKGHIEFFKIIENIVNSNFTNFSINIIGGGRFESYLKEYAKKLEILEYMNFKGSISHSKISKFLDNTDIFVSLNYFGVLGNNVIEASSKGIPIIALDNKNVSYKFKKYFLTVPSNKLVKVGELIIKLSIDKKEYEKYSKLSIEFFKNNITDWNERVNKEMNIIFKEYNDVGKLKEKI